jgi:hypothetical protein
MVFFFLKDEQLWSRGKAEQNCARLERVTQTVLFQLFVLTNKQQQQTKNLGTNAWSACFQ